MRHKLRGRPVKKVAVLRANAIGDFIFALPALEALKQRYPEAELVYLGKQWHHEFLTGRPGPVDRAVVMPRCNGVPHEADRVDDPAAVNSFFDDMHREHFDIAVQLHGGGGNSNPLVAALGARLTVGLQADGAPALDINIPYCRYQAEVLRYLEVVGTLGATVCSLQPRLTLTSDDTRALRDTVSGLPSSYVVLHPGATDVRRRWSARNFAAVGDALAAAGYTVCVTATEAEEELAAEVLAAMTQPAMNLAGRLNLRGLAALLAHAELVISNDTGPLHLARALETPNVAIYWVGNAISYGPVTVTGSRFCISWEMHCPRCGLDCAANDARVWARGCDHEVSFVDSVTPGEILQCVESLQLPEKTPRAARMG